MWEDAGLDFQAQLQERVVQAPVKSRSGTDLLTCLCFQSHTAEPRAAWTRWPQGGARGEGTWGTASLSLPSPPGLGLSTPCPAGPLSSHLTHKETGPEGGRASPGHADPGALSSASESLAERGWVTSATWAENLPEARWLRSHVHGTS